MDFIHQAAWWYLLLGLCFGVGGFIIWENFHFTMNNVYHRWASRVLEVLAVLWIADLLFWAITGLFDHRPL